MKRSSSSNIEQSTSNIQRRIGCRVGQARAASAGPPLLRAIAVFAMFAFTINSVSAATIEFLAEIKGDRSI